MKEAKLKPGKIIVDIHTHPLRARYLNQLYNKLGSKGIVGL